MNEEFFINLLETLLRNIVSITSPSMQQTILVFGVFFVLLFKKNIRNLIDRIIEVGKGGIKCNSMPEQTPVLDNVEKKLNENSQEFLLPTIKHNISLINKYITENKDKFPTDKEEIEHLKYCLADITFILRCERVYQIIFGSQIRVLKKLNAGIDVSIEEINIILEENKKALPLVFEKWDVNMYMYFLIESNLIEVIEEKYLITNFGMDFIKWMNRFGKTENKLN